MPERVSKIGKQVRDALYVHRDALPEVDAASRQTVDEAVGIAGDFAWNVVRIETKRVALLDYEDFEDRPFPALRRSALVDLTWRKSAVRVYSKSANPPILHRKELLLSFKHPRRDTYARLTADLDRLELFAESHKIGLRKAWQRRLDDAEIVIRDHSIVRPDDVAASTPAVQVDRHKTAIPRNGLSSPMQMFVRHGFLDSYPDVFDFGCGQGDDLRVLEQAGVAAKGWDPHFRPDAEIRSADLVNLGFVLNVIEVLQERRATLEKAWALCRKVLAVAVMVEGHYSVQGLKPFGDGFLTSRGTFQKYFAPHELRAFVRETLGMEPVAVAPGIVLVFRDGAAEQEFLFRRRNRLPPIGTSRIQTARPSRDRRPVETLPERLRPLLQQLWEKAIDMGRPPEADEIQEIADALSKSNVSLQRALGWCRSFFDEAPMESAARRLREDLLVHFALGAFAGSPAFGALPFRSAETSVSRSGVSRRHSPRRNAFCSRWGSGRASMPPAWPRTTTTFCGKTGKTASISKDDGYRRCPPLFAD